MEETLFRALKYIGKYLFFSFAENDFYRYNNHPISWGGEPIGNQGFLWGESFSSKLKNKGCFSMYFDVLNDFSFMHFVDWKLLKVGNQPRHRSVRLPRLG